MIPESAPFSPAQRAWLNGFLAGLFGEAAPAEAFPWHDPALELAERLALAEGQTLPRRLMAAMAQLDCGQCGYLCQTYGEALAEGRETSRSLCVPGGKTTSQALKRLLGEAPPIAAAPRAAAAEPWAKVRVLSATRLTGAGSAKDVRHVVIDLAGSGLGYAPGDSISLAAPGDPSLTVACVAALKEDMARLVPCPDGVERPLLEAFVSHVDIARPLDDTLELLAISATRAEEAAALRRLAEGEEGAAPEDADLLDLLEAFPSARPKLAELVRSLPPLRPRLYSIASSPRAAPGQAHLCVSVVRRERRGRVRLGVASSFLAERAGSHGPIGARITSSHFRLPADPATPIIMVGPGTGIAPFRAFLQERAAAGHRGRTWLFFGEQHQASDFLFRDELERWLADGTLGRLDLAFSRDQAQKVYVQHRMAEAAGTLWRWLQEGACFYVCGDALRMARDVDAALRGIAMSEGGLDAGQAREWLTALAQQGRYLRDVY